MQRELQSVIMLLTWQIRSTFHFFQQKNPHQIWESSELLALWSPPHYPLVSLYFLWHYLFSSLVAAACFHFAFPLVVHFNNCQWAPESQFKSEIFWTVIFRTLCDKTWWNWDQIKPLQSLILLFISIWVRVWGKWHVYDKSLSIEEKQLSQLAGIISAARRMMLTQLVFCVDSVLHLLPQQAVTQLIWLTVYVGTTQLGTTKQVRSVQVNCPQDSSSAASHRAALMWTNWTVTYHQSNN